jgi:hypothetical protein
MVQIGSFPLNAQDGIYKNGNKFTFEAPKVNNVPVGHTIESWIIKRQEIETSLNEKKLNFGIKSGVRGEYWCWSPTNPNAVESINLHRNWHYIIKQLGATSVKSEVDIINDRIYKSIKIMGGIFLEEITLHDGRKRAIVEYDLSKY